jgi:hypothetical protein
LEAVLLDGPHKVDVVADNDQALTLRPSVDRRVFSLLGKYVGDVHNVGAELRECPSNSSLSIGINEYRPRQYSVVRQGTTGLRCYLLINVVPCHTDITFEK